MADLFERFVFTAKLTLLFVGFISTVFLFKVAVIPYTFDLILSTLPTLWISLKFWFSPPFLYIIVNFIIFFILISSFSPKPQPSDEKIAISGETTAFEYKQPDPNLSQGLKLVKEGEEREEEKQMIWNFSAPSDETVSDPHPERPPEEVVVVDDNDDGDDEESLEATWKAIMEEKWKDERHLKKSQTLDIPFSNLGRAEKASAGYGGDDLDPVAWAKRELKKSDTFNDSVSYRREKSMSQEELKKRSEEFINKFNTDMRLQRLESAQRFLLRHC